MTPTALLRASFPGPANAGLRVRVRTILAGAAPHKADRVRDLAGTVALTAQGRAKLDAVAATIAEPSRRFLVAVDGQHGDRPLLALDLDAGSYGAGALLAWPLTSEYPDAPTRALGPADPLYGDHWTAAHAVASWALIPHRSAAEVAAARAYLAQWPQGPQLPPSPAATLGARGGAAGTGASKRRSAEQYREMAARSNAARRAKRA